ncbi:hypothetical protein Lfu02_06430 [Longispora fulva]|uniref:Uncharacterized protein n=1 Tax=Longispora fulva TaxID=619741 RepID=A0A8J7GG95_9ACTN|nr:hypothetical protein [Longispora fulva]MBG6135488.1 hypothetical protein [Longispora fulva]GIG56271.1 hypothetical protein Lfu02_06430 [Longispora fulva]
MRLADVTWRTVIDTVRLGPREYRVLRPARPIRHAMLYEGRLGAQLTVDKAATVDLAMAWALAARSPHTLVHLPLRAARPDSEREPGQLPLDLVLLHHSLAFPVSRWKDVRARLGPGTPHQVTLPSSVLPALGPAAHDRRHHRGFRDHLRWDVAADTLFLTGSRAAFELAGEQIRTLAEDCPAHIAQVPDTHCCAEILMGRAGTDRRRPFAELHVEYCSRHR